MAPERTPAAAFRSTFESLQAAWACVSRTPLQSNWHRQPGTPFWTGFPPGREPVLGASGLRLRIVLAAYYVVGGVRGAGFTAECQRYEFALEEADSGREYLAFHQHAGLMAPDRPHLHLGAGLGPLAPAFQRAHVPTGTVTLSAFVRFLIEELGAAPLRPAWQTLLTEE